MVLVITGRCRDTRFQTWPGFFMLLLMGAHADVQFQEYTKIISQHVNDISITTRLLSFISTCCCWRCYRGFWDMMFQTWPVFFVSILMCAHADELLRGKQIVSLQNDNNTTIITTLWQAISTCCCWCGYCGLWDMRFQTWPVFFVCGCMRSHLDGQVTQT